MRIIGIDCATKTGWCVLEDGGEILESGVQDFTKKRGESNGLMFLRFKKWLRDLIDMINPAVIAYERAHYRGGAATEICVGLQTHLQSTAQENSVESAPFTTAEIKKFATGKGNTNKAGMIAAAKVIIGRDPIDDNEADAIHIARIANEMYGDNQKGG